MKNTMKVVLASLVGGFAVYTALSACGGTKSASASPSACATWQVMFHNPVRPGTDLQMETALPLSPGWEPFAVSGETVVLRGCAP